MQKDPSPHQDKIWVNLNVSGITDGFFVTTDVLASVKGSGLEAMFGNKNNIQTDENGDVRLNRDPVIFRYVLNHLRLPLMKTIMVRNAQELNLLKEEFKFWLLPFEDI